MAFSLFVSVYLGINTFLMCSQSVKTNERKMFTNSEIHRTSIDPRTQIFLFQGVLSAVNVFPWIESIWLKKQHYLGIVAVAPDVNTDSQHQSIEEMKTEQTQHSTSLLNLMIFIPFCLCHLESFIQAIYHSAVVAGRGGAVYKISSLAAVTSIRHNYLHLILRKYPIITELYTE